MGLSFFTFCKDQQRAEADHGALKRYSRHQAIRGQGGLPGN